MKVFFRKLFGIYPGEGKRTLRFTFLIILWSFGATCISTLTDGLFIEKIGGDILSKVYLTAAITMIIGSSLILWLLRIMSPYKILIGVLSLGSIITFFSALIIFYHPPLWFWFFLKAFSLTFIANLIACSWALIDHYHDLQDAKRTYALYNAAYFSGAVLSGSLIFLLLGKFGNEILFFLSSISYLVAIFQVQRIGLKDQPVHDETIEGVFSGDRKGIFYLIKKICTHPFVLSLMVLSIIIQLLCTTTEFSYLNSFGKFFEKNENVSVTEFLGNARAWISAFNIILGVFFYNRFIRWSGLKNILILPAAVFFLLYSEWVIHDSIYLAIFGLIAVDGISYTIEDNNYNQLINAVPSKLKAKVRIINDSFFEPVGMLFSSLLLFSTNSRWLGLSLAVIMLIFSLIIRAIYHRSVFMNLKENAVHFERKINRWISCKNKEEQQKLKQDLLKGLKNPCEDISLLACEALFLSENKSLIKDVLTRADAYSQEGKIRFLKLLEDSCFAKDPQVLGSMNKWMQNSDRKTLIKKCYFYLAKYGLLHPEKISDLDQTDILLKAAFILALKNFSYLNPDEKAVRHTIALKHLDTLLHSARNEELLMGLDILSEWNNPFMAERALKFLASPNIAVQRKASFALSKLADQNIAKHSESIIKILEEKTDNQLRLHCLNALGKIKDFSSIEKMILSSIHFKPNERRRLEDIIVSMGLKCKDTLINILKDSTYHDRCRILAGKILSRVALPFLQANLEEIIQIEVKRAYFYFFYANTIQKKYPLHDLSMLVTTLKNGLHSVIDFIIHLLAAAGSVEDCELLVRSLRSKNAKIHSHAVETLEKTCSRKIFNWIAPLIDDLPWEEIMKVYTHLSGDKPRIQLSKLLCHLDRSSFLLDRVMGARLKTPLNPREEENFACEHPSHNLALEPLEI